MELALKTFELPRRFAEEIKEHALADSPNECCGLIAGYRGEAVKLYRTKNGAEEERRAFLYVVEPKELLHIYREIEKHGCDLLAIYHSHVHMEAYPSTIDTGYAAWPGVHYIIAGISFNPVQLRSYQIDPDTEVVEEERLIIQ